MMHFNKYGFRVLISAVQLNERIIIIADWGKPKTSILINNTQTSFRMVVFSILLVSVWNSVLKYFNIIQAVHIKWNLSFRLVIATEFDNASSDIVRKREKEKERKSKEVEISRERKKDQRDFKIKITFHQLIFLWIHVFKSSTPEEFQNFNSPNVSIWSTITWFSNIQILPNKGNKSVKNSKNNQPMS